MTENQQLIVSTNTDLIAPSEVRSDSNPVIVYLAKLTSAHSKRTMGRALDCIADMLTGGLPDHSDRNGNKVHGAKAAMLGAAWGQLCYQHTAKLRADLMQQYSASTANTYLSALCIYR